MVGYSGLCLQDKFRILRDDDKNQFPEIFI